MVTAGQAASPLVVSESGMAGQARRTGQSGLFGWRKMAGDEAFGDSSIGTAGIDGDVILPESARPGGDFKQHPVRVEEVGRSYIDVFGDFAADLVFRMVVVENRTHLDPMVVEALVELGKLLGGNVVGAVV